MALRFFKLSTNVNVTRI